MTYVPTRPNKGDQWAPDGYRCNYCIGEYRAVRTPWCWRCLDTKVQAIPYGELLGATVPEKYYTRSS